MIWYSTYVLNICHSRFRLGDGAIAITNAGEEVFGTGPGTGIRLMCWPHVYRNIIPQLASIRKVNKKLAADLEELQWSAHDHVTLTIAFNLLKKYIILLYYCCQTHRAGLAEPN